MERLERNYWPMMKVAIAAAAAAGPLGSLTGPADMIAVTGIWTTLLISMMNKAECKISPKNAKTIATAVATGAVSYYVGCKVASWMFYLIPFAGVAGAIGISTAANILFTYRFGLSIASMIEKNIVDCRDKSLLLEIATPLFRKLPSIGELREIKTIYGK